MRLESRCDGSFQWGPGIGPKENTRNATEAAFRGGGSPLCVSHQHCCRQAGRIATSMDDKSEASTPLSERLARTRRELQPVDARPRGTVSAPRAQAATTFGDLGESNGTLIKAPSPGTTTESSALTISPSTTTAEAALSTPTGEEDMTPTEEDISPMSGNGHSPRSSSRRRHSTAGSSRT